MNGYGPTSIYSCFPGGHTLLPLHLALRQAGISLCPGSLHQQILQSPQILASEAFHTPRSLFAINIAACAVMSSH
jgi:hypothetical protein